MAKQHVLSVTAAVVMSLVVTGNRASAAEKPSVDKEAVSVAQAIWAAHFVNCGTTYYHRYRAPDGAYQVESYIGIRYFIERHPDNTVDRLNGIYWSGYTFVTYTAYNNSYKWENSLIEQSFRNVRPMPYVNVDLHLSDVNRYFEDTPMYFGLTLAIHLEKRRDGWYAGNIPTSQYISSMLADRGSC